MTKMPCVLVAIFLTLCICPGAWGQGSIAARLIADSSTLELGGAPRGSDILRAFADGAGGAFCFVMTPEQPQREVLLMRATDNKATIIARMPTSEQELVRVTNGRILWTQVASHDNTSVKLLMLSDGAVAPVKVLATGSMVEYKKTPLKIMSIKEWSLGPGGRVAVSFEVIDSVNSAHYLLGIFEDGTFQIVRDGREAGAGGGILSFGFDNRDKLLWTETSKDSTVTDVRDSTAYAVWGWNGVEAVKLTEFTMRAMNSPRAAGLPVAWASDSQDNSRWTVITRETNPGDSRSSLLVARSGLGSDSNVIFDETYKPVLAGKKMSCSILDMNSLRPYFGHGSRHVAHSVDGIYLLVGLGEYGRTQHPAVVRISPDGSKILVANQSMTFDLWGTTRAIKEVRGLCDPAGTPPVIEVIIEGAFGGPALGGWFAIKSDKLVPIWVSGQPIEVAGSQIQMLNINWLVNQISANRELYAIIESPRETLQIPAGVSPDGTRRFVNNLTYTPRMIVALPIPD